MVRVQDLITLKNEIGFNNKEIFLMHRNKKILRIVIDNMNTVDVRFDLIETLYGIGEEHEVPLIFDNYLLGSLGNLSFSTVFNIWLMNREMFLTDESVSDLKKDLKYNHLSILDLLLYTKGLSLSDDWWVQESDLNLNWFDIQPKVLYFNKVVKCFKPIDIKSNILNTLIDSDVYTVNSDGIFKIHQPLINLELGGLSTCAGMISLHFFNAFNIQVQNCDSIKYNFKLCLREKLKESRSISVKNYLISKGILDTSYLSLTDVLNSLNIYNTDLIEDFKKLFILYWVIENREVSLDKIMLELDENNDIVKLAPQSPITKSLFVGENLDDVKGTDFKKFTRFNCFHTTNMKQAIGLINESHTPLIKELEDTINSKEFKDLTKNEMLKYFRVENKDMQMLIEFVNTLLKVRIDILKYLTNRV